MSIKLINTVAGLTFAALAVSAASLPARAADVGDATTVSRMVSTAGLDLTVAGDRAVLRHRIAMAAAAVCREPGETGLSNETAACIGAARDGAWAKAQVAIAAAEGRTLLASAK